MCRTGGPSRIAPCLGTFAIVLCALVSGGVPPRPVSAHASTHRALATRTLFQWKVPTAGHTRAWRFSRGIAGFDGETTDVLFPHYTLPSLADFAVQARIRWLGAGGPKAYLTGFGLVLRQRRADPHTSIEAGSFQSTDSENNGPELYWNWDTVGGEAFSPGRLWHLFRLEVHGALHSLFIDGRKMVSYTITGYDDPRAAGIFSLYDKIEVGSFEVVSIPAVPDNSMKFPPVKQFDLTVRDLPTDAFYQPLLRHYYPNDETARERGVTLAAIQASGRITSYGIDFYTTGGSVIDIYASVTAYTSSTAAAADIPNRIRSFREGFSSYPNYREFSNLPVGQSGQGLTLDGSPGGYPMSLLALLFQRGAYDVLVRVTVVRGGMTANQLMDFTVNLSKIVDVRIEAGVRSITWK